MLFEKLISEKKIKKLLRIYFSVYIKFKNIINNNFSFLFKYLKYTKFILVLLISIIFVWYFIV